MRRLPPDLMIAMNVDMYRLSLNRLGMRRELIRYIHDAEQLRGMRGVTLWLGIGWSSSHVWRGVLDLYEIREYYGLKLAWVPEECFIGFPPNHC